MTYSTIERNLPIEGTTDPTDYFGPIPGVHRAGWYRYGPWWVGTLWNGVQLRCDPRSLNENFDSPDEFQS